MKIAASVTPNKTRFGPLLYPGELERGIRELSSLGYDGIELSLRTPEDIEKSVLFSLLERNGMELISIATGQSYLEDGLALFHVEADKRERCISRIFGYIDLLAETGGGSVILGGIKGSLNAENQEKQYEQGCSAMDTCLEYASRKGVILLLEAINRYETNIFNTINACREFVKERDTEYIKILPDTFHMNIEEVSMLKSLDAAAEEIGAIHCADSNRLAPGMGHTNFQEILKHAGRYPGIKYLGIEVLPLPDSGSCAKTAIDTINGIVEEAEE
ncbi:MAG: sugar phosphate isomerase/epimerase [Spirochaetia bacterium]|nr:sugar phosphate isomerase/epimerase [Spirochaetia bacterium]